ncbi:hypothetical protein NG796_25030 [Laspinema sp. A4]|uniref:hypothetical protein n=1 Tax=Laspinema sp. D2d TaxID=2953686 RepID=UPI0021BAFB19|nr:hypothetical protein [Laspinema sp. D2d]MCT7986541.1 hypothetical protein [Laspinema sp. D2d]
MPKLLSTLLTFAGVSLSLTAIGPAMAMNSERFIAQGPESSPESTEEISQTDMGDRADLERGISDFDWDLPNQNPETEFGTPLLLPIRLTVPSQENEGDGLAVQIDFTRLDRLEQVEGQR